MSQFDVIANYKTKIDYFNVANNPYRGNCYDSLGDLYLETGEKTKAIESFKKALTLKAIPKTKEKFEKLLNERKIRFQNII